MAKTLLDCSSPDFDRRRTPARPDLAANFLKDHITAERYVAGTPMQVSSSMVPLRRTPQDDGAQETQMLFGEIFTVYEEKDGWGWGQASIDDYVGYADMAALSVPVHPHTHYVSALRTYRYSQADLKSAPLGLISMNAGLAISGATEGRFVKEARGGYVIKDHLTPLGIPSVTDYVDAAVKYLNTPYLWGGRESLGLDCSALVQNTCAAAGHNVPRDSDHLEAYFKNGRGTVLFDKAAGGDWKNLDLMRGDLLFWRGHVAIMVDKDNMIHANGTHMAVTKDNARAFSGAVAAEAGAVTAVVRPVW